MPRGVYEHKKGRVITWGDKISMSCKGKQRSEEARLHMSESHRGKLNPNKGKIGLFSHTEEAKEKIRVASLRRTYVLGRKLSEDHKRKIGLKSKGRHHTEEAKIKIRNYFTGRKRPELTGGKNPMHTHPNSYKSKFGKCGYRQDIGIFVRSRWEANVYRIYKYLGYEIEYEPKSFKLSDGRTYRPDFYIKELNLWIEVKGRWLKDAKSRFDLFQLDYPEISIQVIDPLKYKELLQTYSSKINMEG